MIRAHEVTLRYPGAPAPAVEGVSLEVKPGILTAVAGPNGSGKSTLVRALTGLLPLDQGRVTIDERPLEQWRRPDLARAVGVVAQREEPVFPLRVRDTVMLGRYAHLGPLESAQARDREAVERALSRCDVAHLADRRSDQLSGGEWQRVRLARALAAEPRALLLDEPTTSLDVRHEMELFELVASLARGGLAALVVTHGLNLAARFCDEMLLLDQGRPVAAGAPADVLRPEVLSSVFRWPVAVTTWHDGAPQVIPLRRDEVTQAIAPNINNPRKT
ncbi:MAG TPA: ABC transporter ATP-binding protein [Gemmatimonadales bacterium]|nr:ABC transporter ATP-binding protein [Gemmatimonadales bacterium]